MPLEIEELPRVDIVLISHTHYDHLDLSSVYRIGNKALWIVPLGVKSYLAGQGIHNCIELNWWGSYSFTSRESVKMSVTFTPTQHWTARTLFDKSTCLWGSFAVKSGDGQSFFFGGDTAYNAACFGSIGEALGPFDLAALPIGAYKPRKLTRHVHCDPEEAIKIHKLLKAKQSVGIHWGTYPLTAEDAVEPPLELHRARMEADVSSSQFFTTVPGQVYALGEEPEDDFALQNTDLYNLYIEQVWSKERNDLELLSSS